MLVCQDRERGNELSSNRSTSRTYESSSRLESWLGLGFSPPPPPSTSYVPHSAHSSLECDGDHHRGGKTVEILAMVGGAVRNP